MEEFTVEEIIGYHIEIILESDREEDQGLGGELLIPGNLDFVVAVSKNYSDPSPEENTRFVRGVAEGRITKEKVEIWLRSVTKKELLIYSARSSRVFLCMSGTLRGRLP